MKLKPAKSSTLIVGLGNPLLGDEGIGFHAAEALARDPRLPAGVSVIQGGTDLLRLSDRLAGYGRVILVDAMLDPDNPGRVEVFRDDFSCLKDRQEGAHGLSAVQALELLRMASPELKQTQFILALVGVTEVRLEPDLSPTLGARLQEIVDQVLELAAE